MAKAPQYFIEIDTYWQNSKSWFVGPFESRDAAESWPMQDDNDDTRETNFWRSDSQCGGDIRSAWRFYPKALTKTEAVRHGLRLESGLTGIQNYISPKTAPTANAIDAEVEWMREVYQ